MLLPPALAWHPGSVHTWLSDFTSKCAFSSPPLGFLSTFSYWKGLVIPKISQKWVQDALSRHSSWNLADSSKQIISWRLQSALRSCRVSWWRKFTALPTLSPFFLWFHSWKIEEYQVNIAKITQITEFPTRGIFFLPMHPLCWSVTERGMKQMTNGQPWRRGAISKNKNLLNSWKVQKE